MRLKIFEPKNQTKKEEPTFIKLVQTSDYRIYVAVVDEDGFEKCSGRILRFEDGKMYRCPSLHKEYGFDLDSKGNIMIGDSI